jgi:hypothetical protein
MGNLNFSKLDFSPIPFLVKRKPTTIFSPVGKLPLVLANDFNSLLSFQNKKLSDFLVQNFLLQK